MDKIVATIEPGMYANISLHSENEQKKRKLIGFLSSEAVREIEHDQLKEYYTIKIGNCQSIYVDEIVTPEKEFTQSIIQAYSNNGITFEYV